MRRNVASGLLRLAERFGETGLKPRLYPGFWVFGFWHRNCLERSEELQVQFTSILAPGIINLPTGFDGENRLQVWTWSFFIRCSRV
jgi:hypothetical protein